MRGLKITGLALSGIIILTIIVLLIITVPDMGDNVGNQLYFLETSVFSFVLVILSAGTLVMGLIGLSGASSHFDENHMANMISFLIIMLLPMIMSLGYLFTIFMV